MTLPYYVSESQTHPLCPIPSSLSHFLYEYCFTLPYLSFPASPSVMPVNPVLLTSIISRLLSDPSGLSLYVHNTFRTWIVLCSLFVQTSNYISRTTPVYFLSLNLNIVLSEHLSLKSLLAQWLGYPSLSSLSDFCLWRRSHLWTSDLRSDPIFRN